VCEPHVILRPEREQRGGHVQKEGKKRKGKENLSPKYMGGISGWKVWRKKVQIVSKCVDGGVDTGAQKREHRKKIVSHRRKNATVKGRKYPGSKASKAEARKKKILSTTRAGRKTRAHIGTPRFWDGLGAWCEI